MLLASERASTALLLLPLSIRVWPVWQQVRQQLAHHELTYHKQQLHRPRHFSRSFSSVRFCFFVCAPCVRGINQVPLSFRGDSVLRYGSVIQLESAEVGQATD